MQLKQGLWAARIHCEYAGFSGRNFFVGCNPSADLPLKTLHAAVSLHTLPKLNDLEIDVSLDTASLTRRCVEIIRAVLQT